MVDKLEERSETPGRRCGTKHGPAQRTRRHDMYYNVFGEKVSRRRYKEMCEAAKNRRELIAAGLTSRRDLFRMWLLPAGRMLVAQNGLSARAHNIFQTTATVA